MLPVKTGPRRLKVKDRLRADASAAPMAKPKAKVPRGDAHPADDASGGAENVSNVVAELTPVILGSLKLAMMIPLPGGSPVRVSQGGRCCVRRGPRSHTSERDFG